MKTTSTHPPSLVRRLKGLRILRIATSSRLVLADGKMRLISSASGPGESLRGSHCRLIPMACCGSSDVYKAVDQWLMDTHIDLDAIKALPNLNLDEPLPIGQTVTDGIKPILARENEIMRGLWRPKPRLYEMVQVRVSFLLTARQAPRVLSNSNRTWNTSSGWWMASSEGMSLVCIIEEAISYCASAPGQSGKSYYFSDNSSALRVSCASFLSSGNATALLETAMNTIASLPPASCTSCKPTIALMTIEPDALSLFQASPLSHHFNILALPPPPGGLRGHTQKQFNQAESAEIVEDTFTMLRDISVLSLKADAFVVSAASNVGVVAIALGGPERPVHSVDFRFKATTRCVSSTIHWYIRCSLITSLLAGRCKST